MSTRDTQTGIVAALQTTSLERITQIAIVGAINTNNISRATQAGITGVLLISNPALTTQLGVTVVFQEASLCSVEFIENATVGDIAAIPEPEALIIAVSDELTAITTGTAKLTFRMPFAMTLSGVRASLTTVSSSGIPTVDIKQNGTSILSTKLTIDVGEKTSTTAAVPAVISTLSLTDDAEMTIDITVAGTGATGLKVYLLGVRT